MCISCGSNLGVYSAAHAQTSRSTTGQKNIHEPRAPCTCLSISDNFPFINVPKKPLRTLVGVRTLPKEIANTLKSAARDCDSRENSDTMKTDFLLNTSEGQITFSVIGHSFHGGRLRNVLLKFSGNLIEFRRMT